MKIFTLTFLLLICTQARATDKAAKKSYTTTRVNGAVPRIDGNPTDPVWDQVEWGGEFMQRTPNEGEAPSEPTAFKILYDDKNLYILIRAFDSQPEKIVKRMSRRDGFDGDFVEINIDSYYDQRTAFSFTATAAGVKGDEYVSNNGDNWDSSWDPIWYLRTSVDDEGWIAEFRIPLSQLRFADKPMHTWGIQFTRFFFRNEERSNWQPVAQDAPGWVHLFGDLEGIEGIKPQKQLEIQPYVVASTERFEAEEGNPFATGKGSTAEFGLDAKIGITSDITLDLTVNPDFGQVDADPSQVNLSAFQVFFREQRPFFIEGNNILDFPITQSAAGGSFNNDNLFYSRRIGGRPNYFPDLDGDEFVDQPKQTRILTAAKLTGKNKNGFSWGILESVTARQQAEIDKEGERRKIVVEPLTNYLVTRVQQDINKGNTLIGAMFTAVNRNIRDDHLNFLHKSAYSGGIDFTHRWKDRTYYVTGKGILSNVSGTEEAILRTQTASERFFQRPDNTFASVDSAATSLTGTGGTLNIGKSSGDFIFQSGVTYRSPQLELNDIGFLIQTDRINQYSWGQYRFLEPFSIFRSIRINANQWLNWDFSGVNTYKAVNMNAHTQFKNFWRFSTGFTAEAESVSNADLRGGPSITYPGGTNYWFWFGSNRQKKVRVSFEKWFYWGNQDFRQSDGYWMNITYRPIDALNISLSPSVSFSDNTLQYITTQEMEGEDRFILGSISQNTYRVSLRLNYNFTPNLSLQYWGQPFISSGEYSDFKLVVEPSADNFENRFLSFSEQQISFDSEEGSFDVDENQDGSVDYSFGDPNFNFIEFRSNMVMRWEFKPGSTLFFVWTQNRSANPDLENNSLGRLADNLFETTAHNIFLMKFAYRFIL